MVILRSLRVWWFQWRLRHRTDQWYIRDLHHIIEEQADEITRLREELEPYQQQPDLYWLLNELRLWTETSRRRKMTDNVYVRDKRAQLQRFRDEMDDLGDLVEDLLDAHEALSNENAKLQDQIDELSAASREPQG